MFLFFFWKCFYDKEISVNVQYMILFILLTYDLFWVKLYKTINL